MAEPECDGRFVGHAKRAMRLQSAIQHLLQYTGHVKFDQPYFFAGGVLSTLINFVGGVQHHQARSVDLRA